MTPRARYPERALDAASSKLWSVPAACNCSNPPGIVRCRFIAVRSAQKPSVSRTSAALSGFNRVEPGVGTTAATVVVVAGGTAMLRGSVEVVERLVPPELAAEGCRRGRAVDAHQLDVGDVGEVREWLDRQAAGHRGVVRTT